jgi:hypothetical protein
MEILIRLDEEDKKNWQVIKDMKNDLIKLTLDDPKPDRSKEKLALAKATSDFWYNAIEKYPYLRNKRIAINSVDGYIFSYAGIQELAMYSR